jgi:hypothetical protein
VDGKIGGKGEKNGRRVKKKQKGARWGIGIADPRGIRLLSYSKNYINIRFCQGQTKKIVYLCNRINLTDKSFPDKLSIM